MTETENAIRNIRWIDPEKTIVVIEASGEIDLHRSAAFQEALLEPLNHLVPLFPWRTAVQE